MTPERHFRIGQIFHAALDVEPSRRAAFLDQSCGDDGELRSEVESLLASHEGAEEFIAAPAFEIAAKTLAADMKPHPIRLASGAMLGPYQIEELIGAGGMGEVYRARDARLNRTVAIKVLPDDIALDPTARARFERESRAAAALNHPHICTLHDIGRHDGVEFIVMEYLEGETLEKRLSRGPLPPAQAIDYGIQAADALDKAHELGIVHRDLKPGNIMLTQGGVKLLDFGLAKLNEGIEGPGLTLRQTQPGMVIGSVQYMSPEQARGLTDVDHRTDIFSLGVVLYEMATGQAPFQGQTASDVLVSILDKDPPPLTECSQAVPVELSRVVAKALEKDVERRYQSAKDLLIDLKNLGRHPASEAKTTSTGRQSIRSRKAGLLALAFIAIAAVIVGRFMLSDGAIESVAVLPFTNVGANPEMEYLADGITESIISQLSQLSRLKVMSHSSVFRYKGRDVDPQTAGRDMNVQAVLMGRVVPRGDQLSISLELVDVRDNRQLWGQQYSENMTNLLQVQSEISQRVSESLRLRLSGAEQEQLSKPSTTNAAAYALYLKGRFSFSQSTGDSLKKAIQYFNEAIAQDPRYALAYVGVANSYIFLGSDGSTPPHETMPKAKAFAAKALSLDPSLPEAHASLGIVKLIYDWDWSGAEKELHDNLPLSPQSVDSFSCALHFADPMGRNDEAIGEIKRALNLDPLSLPTNIELGCASYYGRQYDQAIRQFLETLALYPSVPLAYFGIGRAYDQRHMYPEAIASLTKGRTIAGDWPFIVSELGYAYAMSGKTDEAQRLLKGLKEQAAREYVDPYLIAAIHIGLDEKDQTFAWLNKALEDRSSSMPWLKVEPKWDSLRSDPRFAVLLNRVGFAQ